MRDEATDPALRTQAIGCLREPTESVAFSLGATWEVLSRCPLWSVQAPSFPFRIIRLEPGARA